MIIIKKKRNLITGSKWNLLIHSLMSVSLSKVDLRFLLMKDTNWFACFLLFLMYEAGSTKTTAMALPAVLSAGQYPMLVSGKLFFLTLRLLLKPLSICFFRCSVNFTDFICNWASSRENLSLGFRQSRFQTSLFSYRD